jgi:heterodisulfide reductase subunit B
LTLEYALYPGCVASVRELGYEISMRNVFKALDIELRSFADFNCCMPACLVHSFDYKRGLALTARNLCITNEVDLPLLTLCSSCFGNLNRAKYLLDTNNDLKKDVNEILGEVGREYKSGVRVEQVVTALYNDYTLKKLEGMIRYPLKDVKAAPFYGCHIFLPGRYTKFDDTEFPRNLDDLIKVTGADSVDYYEKTSCCIGCGSFFGEVSEKAALILAESILDSASKQGADCIITTCPFCIMQLEMGQIRLKKEKGIDYKMPVMHYVDLLGLSMGLKPKELGLDMRRSDMAPLFSKINVP